MVPLEDPRVGTVPNNSQRLEESREGKLSSPGEARADRMGLVSRGKALAAARRRREGVA
jgi:hypothetical protein